MLSDRLRQMNRYREIAGIIAKYGGGYLFEEVGLTHLLSVKDRLAADIKSGKGNMAGVKIREMLEELGPTFTKVGQLLSIRSDLLPPEIIEELEKLQDDVPNVPVEKIIESIKAELGDEPSSLFNHFNEECIAAGSIGQVHAAVLKTGENVVLKIQRPGIKRKVLTDLEILQDLAKLAEKRYTWAEEYQISEIASELADTIKMELDYMEEARNTEMAGLLFENDSSMKVPKVYWEYTTERILAMEAVKGVKVTDPLVSSLPNSKKHELVEGLVQAFMVQIFEEGFFHGDPHPGNLLYDPDADQLVLIDFGQVGRLTPDMRQDAGTLLIGLMKEDTDMMLKALYGLSKVPYSSDERHIYGDLDRIRKKYSSMSIGNLNVGLALQEIFTAAQRHKIIIRRELTVLAKALITIEGIISDIAPDQNLINIARPYGEKLLLERHNPFKMGKRVLGKAEDVTESLASLPIKAEKLIDQTSEGGLKVEISLSEIKGILHKLDRVSNQVSFSLTLLAFSIVVLGLIVGASFSNEPFLTKIPAVEMGFVIATLMFLWILYSILRSGRF